jgi:hypothetical protein
MRFAPARIVVATDIENGCIARLNADGGLGLPERGSELRVLRGAIDRTTGRCHFVPGGAP